MIHVFDIGHLPDVPTTGQWGVLLRARVDLDLATRTAARAEMLDTVSGPGDALVLDLGRTFVGAALVRDLVALSEHATHTGKPVAVVAAPPWLVELTTRLDMPPLRFADTVPAAVQELHDAAVPPRRHDTSPHQVPDGTTDPVLTVIRVTVPARVDPYVLQAALARAISTSPMSVELEPMPVSRQPPSDRRGHRFVAVLQSSTGSCADALARAAQDAVRKALLGEFGPTASAEVVPVSSAPEVHACWYSLRGTPRRP
jgi:anti-anti-sigma regulatory factor